MSTIIIDNPVSRFEEQVLGAPVSLKINDGENVVFIGPNGGGKSLLMSYINGGVSIKSGRVDVLRSDGTRVPRQKIASLSFRDIYRAGGASQDNYYQKRWQATENEESAIVADILGSVCIDRFESLIDKLGIRKLLSKRVIFLSSGELRKLMIFRSLTCNPEIIIIDNPYIGLDSVSRGLINEVLSDIAKSLGVQMLLLLCHPKDIPSWTDSVYAVMEKKVICKTLKNDFLNNRNLRLNLFPDEMSSHIRQLPKDMRAVDDSPYEYAVVMNKVCVSYGDVCILNDVSWSVRRGEKWSLLGRNGCGKSTLLSLVCGDNPQGYANDISLFDRKRGTGESIWEIKSHIGYISPDMHTFYQADISCLDVVASGFFDTIGLYRRPNDEQRGKAIVWMRLFGCVDLADRSFMRISYGEQRIVLLTRVFVKQPSLVILDEPLHGLDAGKKNLAKLIIEDYCSDSAVTLIYVTHYEEEIPSIVSKRKVLKKE